MRFSQEEKRASQQVDPYPDFALTDLLAGDAGVARRSSDIGNAMPLHDIADVASLLDPSTTGIALQGHPPPSGTAANTPGPDPDLQLMHGLHAEYVQLMRDPYGYASTQTRHSHRLEPVDALDVLQSEEHDRDDVYDLLGESDAIGPVLAGLDPFGEHDILEPEPHVEVLRLFAPDELREQRSAVPVLTRREHHVLSADSALNADTWIPSPSS